MPRHSRHLEKASSVSPAAPRGRPIKKKHEGKDPKWGQERESDAGIRSSATMVSWDNQRGTSPLLRLPDDVMQLIILHMLDTPGRRGVLAHRSLENLEYVLWFALAHPNLSFVLRTAIHTLVITQHDSITVSEFFLVARALRNLSILGHSLAPCYLDEIASFTCPTLHSLTLDNVTVPKDSFVQVVRNAELYSLTLSFVTLPDLSAVFTAIAPALSQLHTLHLSGLSSLDASSLIKLCTSAQGTLRQLSFRYLRHISLTDSFFKGLGFILNSLTELCIEDVRHATTTGIARFIAKYADSLEALQLRSLPIPADVVHTLVSRTRNLQQLTIQYPVASSIFPNPDVLVHAYVLNAQSLHVVGLHAIPTLRDKHVFSLSAALQRLSCLSLRRCPGITDAAISAIASNHSKSLRTIDLRGCHLTDVGVAAFGQCTELQNVFLGGEDEPVPPRDSHLFDPHGITNEGIDALLRGCGKSLRSFFWQSPRTVISEDGSTRVHPLGVEGLEGKALAQSLAKFCPSIARVEINWLRPHPHLRESRAECDLAFFSLDRLVPSVSVYLDREPL